MTGGWCGLMGPNKRTDQPCPRHQRLIIRAEIEVHEVFTITVDDTKIIRVG